ncbi:hypothetical protein I5Q34_01865 [Streptomyces sp. AV19]|uniref:hypothetical protein n=1 Tax=Streptomyces sp. AV19 TaxID=2793068 RepID=UPI0018FE2E03|nr:hypothetical protein [Streptomyces sp. AV19]MBH1933047.1 hypothetical protein [Streptomyces sp. AV19]MDG4531759.1 hypothetical protein [Streptomyces sp. AV19]
MSGEGERLRFADAGEAADLAAFLARLIRYDRAAVVRLQAGGGVLAVFGRPPSFEVLAIRTARLLDQGVVDVTVSAGQLADAVDAGSSSEGGLVVPVPPGVTGPPWTGVLPPRGGWQRVSGMPDVAAVRGAVGAAVAEFRSRDEALPEQRRTRAERDRIGREIWSRTLGETGLPLRAAHAAQALGFLAAGAPEAPALFAAGGWLRLRTPYGSIVVRTGGFTGLTVTPA